ncbi:MAG: GNAT family N-acetyltransferase [Firmicutes bacterium]|nr:GNAT family N-acetyltransferase [Bacillota bacterium]
MFYKENKPLGFIIAHINEQRNKQQNKKVIYIEEVGIFKQFRNKGYGKQIIKFIINKGKDKGMKLARLHVYRDNEVAHKIYKKLGFFKVKSIGHWINKSN